MVTHASPRTTRAPVAPIGHPPDVLCAPDMVTIPAQLPTRNVHAASAPATETARMTMFDPIPSIMAGRGSRGELA